MEVKLFGCLVSLNAAYSACELLSYEGSAHGFKYTAFM